jgi:F0F1-type ATP synthase assembly protein I
MIKVMNLVGLIIAPIVVEYAGFSPLIVAIVVIGVVAIVWAVRRSDRQVVLTEDESMQTFSASEAAGD